MYHRSYESNSHFIHLPMWAVTWEIWNTAGSSRRSRFKSASNLDMHTMYLGSYVQMHNLHNLRNCIK